MGERDIERRGMERGKGVCLPLILLIVNAKTLITDPAKYKPMVVGT